MKNVRFIRGTNTDLLDMESYRYVHAEERQDNKMEERK